MSIGENNITFDTAMDDVQRLFFAGSGLVSHSDPLGLYSGSDAKDLP